MLQAALFNMEEAAADVAGAAMRHEEALHARVSADITVLEAVSEVSTYAHCMSRVTMTARRIGV
jgi:hypothetical protein